MRRILIVGSTGSIGTQALDVIERNPELEVVGLAAASSWELLTEQAAAHGVGRVALADADAAARASEHSGVEVLAGPEGLVSGNHGEVDLWRRDAAIEKTRRNRPDLTNDRSA